MNTFGETLKVTIFGESHGEATGMVLDGLPAGEEIDLDRLRADLKRRAPGQSETSTPRREEDEPELISGVLNGHSTGAPICGIIRNTDVRSSDYHPETPRPGHADLTARIKYKGMSDFRGGGPFSGRLTVAMVMAGGICRQSLERRGVKVSARIIRIGRATESAGGEETEGELPFAFKKEILDARSTGDSVGGEIECIVHGAPAGLGGLLFGGMESRIAAALYAIPGVKGVEFGAGFDIAKLRGSAANDPIRIEDGRVFTTTNNAGGINGGLTNGMPLVVRCAFRPTPSISREQMTVDLLKLENTTLRVTGRHDPCIVPRAVPVVESMVAFCVLDAMCGQ